MKKLCTSILFMSIALSFLVPQSVYTLVHQKKPWTFLVYMAAANSLNEFASLDINEMKRVGSNANINILVHLTVTDQGGNKITARLYIEPGKEIMVEHDEPMDSGARATLTQAVQWAMTDYPSDNFALVLWNHGSGELNRKPSWLRGICYDDTTGSFLTDLDVRHVLQQMVQKKGKKVDIVACDACLMADFEIAYALQDYVNFFVASQETIPGEGFDYAGVLAKFKNGTMTAELFARSMITSYDHEYAGKEDYTLSLIDLTKLSLLVRYNDQIAQVLTHCLATDRTGKMRKIIANCVRGCLRFTEATYMDLFQFYRALVKNIPAMPISGSDKNSLGQALTNAQRAYNACVLDNVHSASLRTSTGMSIYFPDAQEGIHASYPLIYWSAKTQWLNFLKAYLNMH